MAQPLAAPYCYFADANGAPLAGGLIYTYTAGTTTPQAAYTDSTGVTPLSNPVVLDSAGRAQIWLSGYYKIIVKDSLGNIISTADNITAISSAGDMSKAVYDAANIQEQLVGIAAVQTLTNKTLTSPTLGGTPLTTTPGVDNGTTQVVNSAWVLGQAAAQADQEAATSNKKFVSPLTQQYHPSAAKAWVRFNGTGTPAVNASYNISGIVDNGVGDYSLTFTTSFSSANYGFSLNGGESGAVASNLFWICQGGAAPTGSAFRFTVHKNGTGAYDLTILSATFFGDQ